jgi:HlyD family secretion protein
VHVETNVDEVDIGKVQVGQRAKVVADAYPDESFWGEVIRIAPLGKTQQNVTTFNVIVLVKNIGNRLKAGMSASVDIEIFNRQNVLLVPTEAVKDPRSEQGRALLASMRQPTEEGATPDSDTSKKADGASGGETDWQALRERMERMSPEERMREFQKMRERFQNMLPEEREKMRAQMRQLFGGQGGGGMQFRGERGGQGGGGMQFGNPGGGMPFFGDASQGRRPRQAQLGNIEEVRERVVMVKEDGNFVPRIIKVGASNFDYAEVVSGLNEGDEVQITTISRAKIAAEQMAERMRSSSNPLGGGNVPGGRR